AWLRAASLAPARGYVALGVDLVHFGGPRFALETLAKLIDEEPEPFISGHIAAEAARAALSVGEPSRALDFAILALERNPNAGDALELAERAAPQAARTLELSALYDAVAARALGRFGRRSAHYRGARFFEQRGEEALALKHAAQAFHAVPTEGATFVL